MPEKTEDGVLKLSADDKRKLIDLTEDLTQSELAIEALDGLGVDVTKMRDMLAWAKTAQDVLLKEFS